MPLIPARSENTYEIATIEAFDAVNPRSENTFIYTIYASGYPVNPNTCGKHLRSYASFAGL